MIVIAGPAREQRDPAIPLCMNLGSCKLPDNPMAYSFDELAERERRRWMKPNAHHYVRPDAQRFMQPDAARFFHPDGKRFDLYDPNSALEPASLARVYPQPSTASRAPAYAGRARFVRASAPALGVGPTESELLKLKSDLAALRVQLTVIRHEDAIRKTRGLPPLTASDFGWQIILKNFARFQADCRKAGFDPNQPRVPAGNPDGGQWTDGGGSVGGINDARILSDATPDNEWKPSARYAQNETGRRSSVILEDEPRFQHIKEHFERNDADLLNQLRKNYYRGLTLYGFQPAEGSFTDVRSANDLINQTLQANSALVDRVAAGEVLEETLEHRFGYRTGKEAFRPDVDADPNIRSTYGVRVVIRHDPQRRNGYRLITAFPINKRKY
jgi:Bacterial CdiA-CT RNAse A domain